MSVIDEIGRVVVIDGSTSSSSSCSSSRGKICTPFDFVSRQLTGTSCRSIIS